MKSHMAANMCKLEQLTPSRTVDSEPENILNTLSPGRNSRWLLPDELETPNRPTSSGLQSPAGAPVQFGPSPQTREYVRPPPCCVPPAQWGDLSGRGGDEECELFGGVLPGEEQEIPADPFQAVEQQAYADTLGVGPAQLPQQPIAAARCINGNLVRPDNADEEAPSTACRQSPGGVPLGKGSPGSQQSPGPYTRPTDTSTSTATPASTSSTCSGSSQLSKGMDSIEHYTKSSRRRRST